MIYMSDRYCYCFLYSILAIRYKVKIKKRYSYKLKFNSKKPVWVAWQRERIGGGGGTWKGMGRRRRGKGCQGNRTNWFRKHILEYRVCPRTHLDTHPHTHHTHPTHTHTTPTPPHTLTDSPSRTQSFSICMRVGTLRCITPCVSERSECSDQRIPLFHLPLQVFTTNNAKS